MNKNGFSAVKLLIVMIILSIAIVLAAPQMKKVIEKSIISELGDTAKLVLSKAEERENELSLASKVIRCSNLIELDDNYDKENCVLSKNTETGKWTVTMAGSDIGEYAGYLCTGTKDDLNCRKGKIDKEENNSKQNDDFGDPMGYYEVNKKRMFLGEEVPEGIIIRFLPSQAIDDWKKITKDGDTYPFYLKYTIENKVATEGYVEFLITNGLKAKLKADNCATKTDYEKSDCEMKYDNLVNGRYAVRGGVDESNSEAKPIYEANMKAMRDAFNYEEQPYVCYKGENDYYCGVDGLQVSIRPDGLVRVTANSKIGRHVGEDKRAECYILD